MPHAGKANIGSGATLSFNSQVYSLVQNINFSGFENAALDITDLDSTAKEYRSSLVDYGSVTFELFYDPSDPKHIGLLDALFDGTTHALVITWPDGSTDTTSGFVTKMAPAIPGAGELLGASVEIKITGAVTHVAGLSS